MAHNGWNERDYYADAHPHGLLTSCHWIHLITDHHISFYFLVIGEMNSNWQRSYWRPWGPSLGLSRYAGRIKRKHLWAVCEHTFIGSRFLFNCSSSILGLSTSFSQSSSSFLSSSGILFLFFIMCPTTRKKWKMLIENEVKEGENKWKNNCYDR